MRVLKSFFAGAALSGLAASATAAAEFCVTCEAPNASYTCSFIGPTAAQDDARLKLYCITELAKTGQHASCAVDRSKRAPCEGAVKTLAMPDGLQIPPPKAPETGAPLRTDQQPPAATAGDAPPKTVKEMVEKGNASTSKALEKTGEVSR